MDLREVGAAFSLAAQTMADALLEIGKLIVVAWEAISAGIMVVWKAISGLHWLNPKMARAMHWYQLHQSWPLLRRGSNGWRKQ